MLRWWFRVLLVNYSRRFGRFRMQNVPRFKILSLKLAAVSLFSLLGSLLCSLSLVVIFSVLRNSKITIIMAIKMSKQRKFIADGVFCRLEILAIVWNKADLRKELS